MPSTTFVVLDWYRHKSKELGINALSVVPLGLMLRAIALVMVCSVVNNLNGLVQFQLQRFAKFHFRTFVSGCFPRWWVNLAFRRNTIAPLVGLHRMAMILVKAPISNDLGSID